jgi:hypothetical protein
MVLRLIRHLIVLVAVFSLLGGVLAQGSPAARACVCANLTMQSDSTSCSQVTVTAVGDIDATQHQMPCKSAFGNCMRQTCCVEFTALQAKPEPQRSAIYYTSVAYWISALRAHGVSPPPTIFPPISA